MTADNHHLAFLIEMLAGNSLPADIDIRTAPEGDLATIFRALMNQWDTRPLPPAFYEQQDAWLQTQAQRKGVVTIEETTPSPVDHRLRLWRGDITRLAVDAIVNAANQQMLGCFVPGHHCIDNAIHSAAGLQLRAACADYMRAKGPTYVEPTGKALVTPGFNLPAKYVIHTVGPIVGGAEPSPEQRELLATSYRSCLQAAHNTNLRSIALCCISTGVFGFPQEAASAIAIKQALHFLASLPTDADFSIVFNVFTERDYVLYAQHLGL